MPAHAKHPLRQLSDEERAYLERVRRAARVVGRRYGDAGAMLVKRFNTEGVAARTPRHGGGSAVVYGEQAWARIVTALKRTPDRETDGTAT